ncbi:MAG: response regulator [Pseudomonadota bacterium]|nr:response regulator [Pseudomonadota bacterium]
MPSGKKVAVLAEDDQQVRQFMETFLKMSGYEVHSFDNGITAFGKLRDLRIAGTPADLLLTDNDMPGTDQGANLVEQWRKEEKNNTALPSTPIVMMSGNTISKAGTNLTDIAAQNSAVFRPKPLSPAALPQAIQEAEALASGLTKALQSSQGPTSAPNPPGTPSPKWAANETPGIRLKSDRPTSPSL